jgi:hypothetical protein
MFVFIINPISDLEPRYKFIGLSHSHCLTPAWIARMDCPHGLPAWIARIHCPHSLPAFKPEIWPHDCRKPISWPFLSDTGFKQRVQSYH